eukprot:4205632-Amphidinium_carterae.2
MDKVCKGIMTGEALPAPLTDSYSVYLNKKEASVVTAIDTRPIVLDNVITKVIPGALAAKLAPVFPRLGHACQYGFVRGRTIPQALVKLEELAFRISKDDKFGALLCVDVKQAFPSLRRKWILEVCYRSGASLQQIRLLKQMMRPNKTYIKWKGRVFPGYCIQTGLNQGSPWSGLAFALAVDPFIRFAAATIPWELPVQRWVLFAGDMIAGARNPLELDIISVVFVVLEDATGMAIGIKSKILPIGWGSVAAFRRALCRVIDTPLLHSRLYLTLDG